MRLLSISSSEAMTNTNLSYLYGVLSELSDKGGVICITIPAGSYASTYVVVALDKMAEEMQKEILYE